MANSPPLKTNNMKLYTEEQVKDMLNGFIGKKYVSDFLHRYYTPIELPTDEEIGQKFKKYNVNWEIRQALEVGAKWMRDKILNK